MSDIPKSHPRYVSLITRENLVAAAHAGIVSYEGLTSHGRGEAFDYLLGEKTSPSALEAEKSAAKVLLAAKHPVLSINGNTAALAAGEIADLQKAADCEVEVNLFHRTDERIEKVTAVLAQAGVNALHAPDILEATQRLIIAKIGHSHQTFNILAPDFPIRIIALHHFKTVRIYLFHLGQFFLVLLRHILLGEIIGLIHQIP